MIITILLEACFGRKEPKAQVEIVDSEIEIIYVEGV